MQHRLIILSLLALTIATGFSQGSLTYQTAGNRDVLVFMPDPSAPTVAKQGGTLSDYRGFQMVEGSGYYAELWWASGADQPEDMLSLVPGSLVTFRTGSAAGLISGRSKLEIPGTFGGDLVTLQLRVWENFEQTVTRWEAAVGAGSIHGKSNLFTHELSGLDREDDPKLGSGTIRIGLRYFSLVVPEPSSGSLLLLGLGMWRLFHVHGFAHNASSSDSISGSCSFSSSRVKGKKSLRTK